MNVIRKHDNPKLVYRDGKTKTKPLRGFTTRCPRFHASTPHTIRAPHGRLETKRCPPSPALVIASSRTSLAPMGQIGGGWILT
uniref:Uncharacterized protein n=1 Tax=Physcomitrium patens TaxID=3218 RepID=A0A2K1I9I7_PHYPA|nr:hypothetical protein PHYPA_031297 [Physcomitrium patens]